MKIAIISDTHCGVRNSSDIFIEYQRQFYEDVFFPYLQDNNIKTIIHLGDYYEHRKMINFKALNENRKHFLSHLKSNGIHMDIIPGNHDVYYKNDNDLCALKELLGFYINEVNIIMEPRVLDYDGCKIALLPWINNNNYEKSLNFIQQCKADILGGHLELSGFEMMRGIINTHGMSAKTFARFDQVWSGHFHTRSTQGNISYLGSQMEFTWADANDPKYFHVFDTDTRVLTPVLNPITIFEKISYDDKNTDYTKKRVSKYKNKYVKVVVVNKTNPYMFDKFIDKLNDAGLYSLSIAESFNEFIGNEVDDENISLEDTTTLLDTYVDNVETDLSKDIIKSQMRELFVEASNLEII